MRCDRLTDQPNGQSRSLFFSALALSLLTIMLPSLASAQGFMVKPMRMEVTASPGQTVEIPLEIRNTAGSVIGTIDLRLVEVSQNVDGSWKFTEIDPAEKPAPYSAKSWARLSQNRVEIAPLEPAETKVSLSPPYDATGAYFIGIIAETPAPQSDSGGIAVRMRFAIPVIIEIEGRPARQQIGLDQVSMNYDDGSDGTPATTSATLRIVNTGRTYSRVKGRLTVERKSSELWRPVTRFDLRERPILPGVTLELGEDLKRRLPSGVYRLHGELTVDGRRMRPMTTEIEFVGDPNADSTAYDTALVLTPGLVDMDIMPGATRTTVLRVENPGSDPVRVQMSSMTPPSLGGVAMGDLLGVSISAEPWTEIVPAEFTIRPGTRQNVRVLSRVPKVGVEHSNYYGDLVLKGTYQDGQSAGETRSTVHLSYAAVPSVPRGMIEQIALSEGDAATPQFFAQVRLTNIGNVHYSPTGRLFLLDQQGRQVSNVALAGEDGPLLPLGKRVFGAELNLDGLASGYYAVRAVVGIGSENEVTGRQIIRIEQEQSEDGKKVPHVTLVDAAETLPEGIELMGDVEAQAGRSSEPDNADGSDAMASELPHN